MATRRKKKGGPAAAWDIERFAAARARGKNLIECMHACGYSKEKSDIAAKKAGDRMAKREDVQKAIDRHKRDLLKAMAKKEIADLWPDALVLLQSLLHDPDLSDTNKLKAVELVARMSGNWNTEAGVQVNVMQIGEQARHEMRKLQSSREAQGLAMDELQRMTLAVQAGAEDCKPKEGTVPVQVELALDAMDVAAEGV